MCVDHKARRLVRNTSCSTGYRKGISPWRNCGEGFDYFYTGIGRTAVNNDMLEVKTSLFHNAFDGLSEAFSIVIVNGDD